jgi:hypothetical protein
MRLLHVREEGKVVRKDYYPARMTASLSLENRRIVASQSGQATWVKTQSVTTQAAMSGSD